MIKVIGITILVAVSLLFAGIAYAQVPQAQELVDPVTGPGPSVTVSGTTAVLPVTGQNILWTLGLGAVVMSGGVLLLYKSKPKKTS